MTTKKSQICTLREAHKTCMIQSCLSARVESSTHARRFETWEKAARINFAKSLVSKKFPAKKEWKKVREIFLLLNT